MTVYCHAKLHDFLDKTSLTVDCHAKLYNFLDKTSPSYFSILHLNFRSIKKRNIKNFKLELTSINFTFSVICFSETWLGDLTLRGNASYELPNYTSKHQERGDRKGGDASINIHNSVNFKIRPDLSIRNNDIESLLYRPLNGQIEPFETFLNNIFSQIKVSNKVFHIAGNFSINLLDHNTNKKVQNFLNLVYQNGMIPTTNKPTSVTRKTAMAIDHILTNCFTETAIIKSDISDHFPRCFLVPSSPTQRENKTTFIYKRIFNIESIESFKKKLYEIDWEETEISKTPGEAYATFLQMFIVLCDKHFPCIKIFILPNVNSAYMKNS